MKYPLALAAITAGLMSFASVAQAAGDKLAPNETLKKGASLTSRNGAYTLTLQTDGNLVLYRKGSGKALWASNTDGRPGLRVIMQGDGNLVLYGPLKPLWDSKTSGQPGRQPDGPERRKRGDLLGPRQAVWATNTNR